MIDNDDDELPGEGDEPSDLPNVAEPKGVRKRKLTQEQKARQDRRWWAETLASEVGRRALWKIIEHCHAFQVHFGTSPTGFPTELATYYHFGEQNVGIWLYHEMLKLDPTAVSAMHRENDPNFFGTKQIK